LEQLRNENATEVNPKTDPKHINDIKIAWQAGKGATGKSNRLLHWKLPHMRLASYTGKLPANDRVGDTWTEMCILSTEIK
jgi:hypothetical protein